MCECQNHVGEIIIVVANTFSMADLLPLNGSLFYSKLINPTTTSSLLNKMSISQDYPVRVSKSFTDKCFVSFLRNLVVNVSFETFLLATNDKTNGTFYSFCTQRPCIFSWPMVISNSVNEFFVAV